MVEELSCAASKQILRVLREFRPALRGIGFGLSSKWDPAPNDSHSGEYRLAARMSTKRRADFLSGRVALRRALADAGLPVPDEPILIGTCGGPALPPGVTASISHSRGIAVAVAAPAEGFSALGVDVELSGLPSGAAHLVLTETEQAALLDLPDEREREQRLLDAFSAKESACKALPRELVGGSLRRIHLVPVGDSFIAWPRDRRDIRLRVRVRRIGSGVLTWTAAPTEERSRACPSAS